MIYNHITELIGNTPILKLSPEITGLKNIDLYAKLELYNPFGSLKDRVAWGMIKNDISDIQEKKQTIIESSSGNTAKGLQVLSSIYGTKFQVITNRIKQPEVKAVLQLLGADIEELPGLSECPDPSDPNDAVAQIEKEIARNPGKYFHTSQYTNEDNPKAHFESTGKEIEDDLGKVDYLIGTLGTTGSTKGVASRLQLSNPELVNIGVVAAKGDTIPGIRNIDEMHEVGIFDKSFYDDILTVDSNSSIDCTIKLIRNAGVLAGPTSGACLQGSLDYLQSIDENLKERKKAVFIVCDRIEWYISYIQKRRPELFHIRKTNKISINTLTNDEINSVNVLSIDNAQNWISENNPLIIDLRSAIAFKTNHLPNSINIQDSYFEEIIDSGVPFSNNQTVLLVCPVGETSKKFAALLNKKGFENIFNLEGGITNWRDQGFKMERSIKHNTKIVQNV